MSLASETDGNILNMPMLVCPKCAQQNARYLVEDKELFVKCQCGYLKCVYSEKGNFSTPQKFNPVQLPRRDTQLEAHMVAVIDAWPNEINTESVSRVVEDSNLKAASNCLWVLTHKQLVVCTNYRNGKRGGSTWRLSEQLRIHLNLKPLPKPDA